MELIKTNLDLCTGCNRCVRECPMEPANVTYQDDDGNIKVRIDQEKCIACGRCLYACKHNARYHVDDTMRFFDDLAKGVPISVIAAPAIRTNIPEWKRMFTYLKSLGVNKLYDVSLGADICIWSNIRHAQKDSSKSLITQPCPVIVTYCEMYRPDLLEYLSPAQSPMACASVYMREYKGISDRIAALSPCVSKTNEFEATGLADYSITFSTLKDYLDSKKIVFPEEETDFDSDESSLGSIFPMPGGLKENIEFFTDKEISVDRAEGESVFKILDEYADSPIELRPRVFDVLNCADGCNMGTACTHSSNIFKINREMDARRKAATGGKPREFFEAVYKEYDDKFALSKFSRAYTPRNTVFPKITEEDIEDAFIMLGKTTSDKQAVDCGACGSDTCRGMARKIALGVNIPINCIVKNMEDAKTEHEENLETHKLLADMEKMHETDLLMRALLDANPYGANFWNRDMELIDVNEAIVGMFKISDKSEYLENFAAFSPEYQPDGRLSSEAAAQFIDTAFKTGSERFEWMHNTLDGEDIPCEITMVRVDYKGEHIVAAYLRDLREQRRMIQEIEAAQSTTSAMFDTNPHVNVLFNSAFKMIDCNPAGISFLGFKNKEEMLSKFSELMKSSIPAYQPDGRPSVPLAQRLMTAAREGHSKFETVMDVKGEKKHLSVEFKRIPYANNFAVVGYLFDLTEAKNLLLDLETEKALLHTMFDSMPDLVFCKDLDSYYTRCNESLLKYFGLQKEDLLGKDDESGLGLPQKVAEQFREVDMAVMEGRELVKYEEYVPSPDGTSRLFETNKVPLQLGGEIVGIMGIARDITERKAMEEAAQSANRAKSAFLSTMSHEIRTPMNAILGITEIQLHNDSLDKGVREGLEKIYTSGDMLLGIINDILDLSKIEAGKLELLNSKYETASLISDTAQLNMMRIGSKPIEFELYIDENLPMNVSGDELRVKQILNNILSNAFKYTEKGMVKMSVSYKDIEDCDDEVTLVVSVSDTGQGMTQEQVDTLFDEYSRFNQESNRSTEGTGLGMSITRNLIRMMRGEIAIESEPGKGSVFTVFLPQGRIDDIIVGKEIAENLHNFRTSSRAQMKRIQITRDPMPYGKVLIVDDVETNIFVARGLLAPYSLKVDSSESGYDAIEKIKNGKIYDIVFMDHMMPKMDGVETTKILRDMGYDQPIVALTANAVAGQAEIFLGNGFDDYISKPIDIRQLNTVLNKLIRDKQPPEVIEEARQRTGREPKETAASENTSDFTDIFIRDANKSLIVLDEFVAKEGEYSEDDIRTFVIHTHGMKSALANIGKMDLSAVALKLEQLGRDKNIEVISVEAPAFLISLREYIVSLKPHEEAPTISEEEEDKPYLLEKLIEIKAACEEYDDSAIEKVLSELRHKTWSKKTNDLIETISVNLLHSDFDEMSDAVTAAIEE